MGCYINFFCVIMQLTLFQQAHTLMHTLQQGSRETAARKPVSILGGKESEPKKNTRKHGQRRECRAQPPKENNVTNHHRHAMCFTVTCTLHSHMQWVYRMGTLVSLCMSCPMFAFVICSLMLYMFFSGYSAIIVHSLPVLCACTCIYNGIYKGHTYFMHPTMLCPMFPIVICCLTLYTCHAFCNIYSQQL